MSETSPETTNVPTGEVVDSRSGTVLADGVVATIAGIAACEVSGVHALAAGTAFVAVRDRLPSGATDYTRGVSTAIVERRAAIEVALVAEHGVVLTDLAARVRSEVVAAVERMVDLEVVTVDVAIQDLHVTGTTNPPSTTTRSA